MNGIKKEAVAQLLKTAALKLKEQQAEIDQLRSWYNDHQKLAQATSVADRLVASGHLDLSDRDLKAQELAEDPSRLPVIEEAINLVQNPSAFQVASISDEPSYGMNAKSQLESYLLGMD